MPSNHAAPFLPIRSKFMQTWGLTPVFGIPASFDGVESGRTMQFAGLAEKLFVGKLPFLEDDIEVFLNVAGTGKASVADFESGQFGKMVIAHGFTQEGINDLSIGPIERMLLIAEQKQLLLLGVRLMQKSTSLSHNHQI